MKAFPLNTTKDTIDYREGMDLRDYFAAKALQGLISTGEVYGGDDTYEKNMANFAYKIADAMMEARK